MTTLTEQERDVMLGCDEDDPWCIFPAHRFRVTADALVLRGLLRLLPGCKSTFEVTEAGRRELYGAER